MVAPFKKGKNEKHSISFILQRMGRFYTGDICGKFWFAVQSSNDAEYFGAEPNMEYTFFGCGCSATDFEMDEEPYCKWDYESYEDHMNQTVEDRSYHQQMEDKNRTFYESNEIRYEFSKEDLPTVNKKVKYLEKKYSKFIETYNIKEDGEQDGIGFDMKMTGNPSQEEITYVAQLCLGRQIKYCLEKKGQCCFFAET